MSLALAAMLPAGALAAGYHFPDLGTVALSRGGAFVARADDPTAMIHNPAGAARLEGTHLLINGNLMRQSISFQRRQYSDPAIAPENYPAPLDAQRMPLVENQAPVFMAPLFGVTSDLGFLRPHHVVLMAGFYGPNAHPRRTYPRYCRPGSDPCIPSDASGTPSPQRYDNVETKVLLVYPTLGVAWQPIPGLSIGGVFQLAYVDFEYATVISAGLTENPEGDVDVRYGANGWAATAILGLHWRALRWLELGASLRFPVDFNTDGEVCVGERQPDGSCEIPSSVKLGGLSFGAAPNPAPASLAVPESMRLRTGVRYVNHDSRERERFDLELDFVWETTSRLDTFDLIFGSEVKIIPAGKTEPLPFTVERIVLPHGWDNTFSLRLGGTYRFHDLFEHGVLMISAGGLYETSPMPHETTRLDFVPLTRVGVGAGIGLRWDRYTINVGYARLFHITRDVDPPAGQAQCSRTNSVDCGSNVKQMVPLSPGVAEVKFSGAVGNGTYKVATDQFLVGASVEF